MQNTLDFKEQKQSGLGELSIRLVEIIWKMRERLQNAVCIIPCKNIRISFIVSLLFSFQILDSPEGQEYIAYSKMIEVKQLFISI